MAAAVLPLPGRYLYVLDLHPGGVVGTSSPTPVTVRGFLARCPWVAGCSVFVVDIFPEWLGEQRQRELFFDTRHRQIAPIVLWGAMQSLAPGVDPIASLVEVSIIDEVSRWRLAWLSDSDVVYVDAAKYRDRWTGYDDDKEVGEPDELVSWARPLSGITAIELVKAEAHAVKERYADTKWRWSGTHRACFADGTVLGLPLFDELHDKAHEDAVLVFVGMLQTTR